MASSPLRSKALHHARSNSFPSSSQPAIKQFDDHLCRLRTSEVTPLSLSSLSNRMSGFQELYDDVDDLLVLPHIQQTISQECQDKCPDEILDGYIRVLDACSIAKDVFSNVRQDVQELLSALRRKDSDGIHVYLTSRRKTTKMFNKSLKDLKSQKQQNISASEIAAVYIFKEAERVTLAMLESILSCIMGSKFKQNGWSMVMKLMGTRKVSCQGEEIYVNEFEKVDTAVQSMLGCKSSTGNDEVMSQLKKMDSIIQDIEEGLECLFRRLIKTRVSLLNILNH